MSAPPDPGLQAERTALAWVRTSLGLAAVSLLCLRLAPEPDGSSGPAALAVAAGGAFAAAAVLLLARRRHRVALPALTASGRQAAPRGRVGPVPVAAPDALAATAGAVVALGVAAAALLVAHGLG